MNAALEKQLLEYFQAHVGRPLQPRDLFKDLRVEAEDDREFIHTLLNDWTIKGILHRKGKHHVYRANHLTGRLSLNRAGEGFVAVEGYDEDFFVSPSRLKTAMHGDQVIIVPVLRKRQTGQRAEAEILAVAERGQTKIVGTLARRRNMHVVVPDDKKFRRDIYVDAPHLQGAQEGQKVVVELESWEDEYQYPEGRVIEVLGFPHEKGVDVMSVVKAHDIWWQFPANVERESEDHPTTIPHSEIQRRLDLRNSDIITIDPFDAKDFDDAISLQPLPEGHWLLGVHIADVSYYVPERGAIDQEAFKRGTSTYLVDRVIPMLPERLSNQLCSLVPHEDRLTYSILMELDAHGNVVDYDIEETVIHSQRRYTYEEVQEILGGKSDPYADLLGSMNALARKLTQKRLKEGSIDFDTPESKFRLDDEGRPIECTRKDRLDSHRLIEEFMLLANQTAALHIGQKDHPFLYRVHDKPVSEKLEKFLHLLAILGYPHTVPRDREKIRPQHIQKLIASVKGHKEDLLIEKVAIRAMAKAEYSHKNIGHFGLGFLFYSHFTSPIRRYPDLIVHRLLKEYSDGMSGKRLAWWKEYLPKAGRHCSERERVATEAERDSIKVKQVEFMEDHIGAVYPGVVSGVTAFGLFVEIEEFLIEGMIAVRNMEDDYYMYDEKRYQLLGKRRRRSFRLGDSVRVRVMRANREKHELDFELAD